MIQKTVEMQAEFEKAILNLTITKDAMIEAELEKTKSQLKNVPTIEEIKAKMESMQRGFEVMIKSGVLDPLIQNGAGFGEDDEEEKRTTMGQLVRKRRRQELMQRERERLLDLMNIPFRDSETQKEKKMVKAKNNELRK
jgi:hypothetical protein